jgi:acetolactate synthase-1/2/3 large subunit
LEDHFVGRIGLFRNQPGDVLISHADVLVTAGFDPVEYDPRLWNSDPLRTVVHIDELPADIDNHYQPTIELRVGHVSLPRSGGFGDRDPHAPSAP